MAEPTPTRRPPDLVQLLLREADEAYQRATAGIQVGGDLIVVAQDLCSAGESFTAAGNELALRERARRAAAAGGQS